VKVAALFVDEKGAYAGLPDVDVWGVSRDARLYPGNLPVVAHPPCARWGRYWFGGPSAKVRLVKGDDGGCFASALASVRAWGGVLEHPEASSAWHAFGLLPPARGPGWQAAGDGGWTCCVEQGWYGHAARKATWLYVFGVDSLPSLRWWKSPATAKLDLGCHSAEERRRVVAKRTSIVRQMSARKRAATPLPFRDLLLSIAASARPASVAA
jgi:hypothetical protein